MEVFSASHLLVIIIIILMTMFGFGKVGGSHRSVQGSHGMRKTDTMTASLPTSAAVFPGSVSPLVRESQGGTTLAELMGAGNLMSGRFIGAFLILLFSLNGAEFRQMLESTQGPVSPAVVVRGLLFTSTFVIVAAIVLRRRLSVFTSASVVALIYGVLAFAARHLLYPDSYRHLPADFELRVSIASFVWPFLWILLVSSSLALLRPWWLALMAGLCVDDLVEHFVTDAVYGVGRPYWSLFPSEPEQWSRLGLLGVQSLISALVATAMFAVLLHFTKASGPSGHITAARTSRCASV
jgi:hypothetical protein